MFSVSEDRQNIKNIEINIMKIPSI